MGLDHLFQTGSKVICPTLNNMFNVITVHLLTLFDVWSMSGFHAGFFLFDIYRYGHFILYICP